MDHAPFYDALIVGAGFSGLYLLHSLRKDGLKCAVVEKASDVGGTWYHNRYPGARCDIESIMYSYQFDEDLQQEWTWKYRYSEQRDIQAYLKHVADRFDLRKDIHFMTTLNRAVWDDATKTWSVFLTGEFTEVRARYLITGVGCLSAPLHPRFNGRFDGPIYHTAEWPEDVSLKNKRVAIIGTGSSAVQAIPEIAKTAGHLYVLQRTPNYVLPAVQRELDPVFIDDVKRNYRDIRIANKLLSPLSALIHEVPKSATVSALAVEDAYRDEVFEALWNFGGFAAVVAFKDIYSSKEAGETFIPWMRKKVASIVKDESVAKLLAPDTLLGCKRPCFGNDYYETFNQDNVTLVSVKDKEIQFCSEGVSVGGQVYPVDVIITATGFDAMTGALTRIDIVGKDGRSLKDCWQDGPSTYFGLQVSNFPNLFTVTGPGSPSVLTNMVGAIEQHVDWIRQALQDFKSLGVVSCEAEESAQKEWTALCSKLVEGSNFPSCNSWYVGSNVPGKPRTAYIYIAGLPSYRAQTERSALFGYRGFQLRDEAGNRVKPRYGLTAWIKLFKLRLAELLDAVRVYPLVGKYGPQGLSSPKLSYHVKSVIPRGTWQLFKVGGQLSAAAVAIYCMRHRTSLLS